MEWKQRGQFQRESGEGLAVLSRNNNHPLGYDILDVVGIAGTTGKRGRTSSLNYMLLLIIYCIVY